MDLLLAGLAGVVIGALLATGILLYAFQKRADRDLIERRLRACFDYRECLGDLEAAFSGSEADPAVLEQAWHQVGGFIREFRRTSWLFGAGTRLRLEAIVSDLERERRSSEGNGAGTGGRAAQLLCDKGRDLDRLLREEVETQTREHRKTRFLPEHRNS